MKFKVDTPGYRNGGFVVFEATSRTEAETRAREILKNFPGVTEIVISKVPKEEKKMPEVPMPSMDFIKRPEIKKADTEEIIIDDNDDWSAVPAFLRRNKK